MRDTRLYGFVSYIDFGNSGRIDRCVLEEVEWLVDGKPEKAIFHLRKHDAYDYILMFQHTMKLQE